MLDLSIIVPVYQVEKYVRQCMESIFRQGLDEDTFEVIIVNDGTKDRSMEVIADIIEQHSNITIINQENQGLSVARNNGIKQAKGTYIFMPDSDDILITNSLRPLLDKAVDTMTDIVVADFLEMDDEGIENFQGLTQNTFNYTEKSGKRLFLEDLNPNQCYVWRSLFRRCFLLDHNLSFYPGIFYQDVPFTHECYIKADKCIRTSWVLTIYRKGRVGAATSSFGIKKAKDYCTMIARTWELTKNDFPPQILHKLKDNVFLYFSLNIWSTSRLKNKNDRLVVINYLKVLVPDFSFSNSLKQIIYSVLYRYAPHYLIVIRLYYGIIVEDFLSPHYHKFKINKKIL